MRIGTILKERALLAGYSTAVTVAMLGWLSALGWAITEILLFVS